MVVFEDGLPRKREYRRFSVRGYETGPDDIAAMHAVLYRRFRRARASRPTRPGAGRRPRRLGRGARPPEPGRAPPGSPTARTWSSSTAVPQVNAAAQALGGPRRRRRRGRRAGQAPRGGLAARRGGPRVLPRTSEGLYLLQRVRDEAHRFAITYHRQGAPRR